MSTPVTTLDAILYPPIEPFETGQLKVSDLHTLNYEVSGNKDGKPVVFLHGGPGGGVSEKDRRYFDPKVYKIVLFDQRGAGKSTPSASIEENTTWDLVADIEKLREHLKIDKWVVFGGSWSHPDRVKALILRGIFTLRRSELDFFYQNGASHIFPEHWDDYLAPIPESERDDMMKAYYNRLTSENDEIRTTAAKAWSTWEMATSKLRVDAADIARAANDDWALYASPLPSRSVVHRRLYHSAFARIEAHYFINAGFMREGQLLERQSIDKMYVPHYIVPKMGILIFLQAAISQQLSYKASVYIPQVRRLLTLPSPDTGRYDVVCPARTAYDLKKAFPELELTMVPDAGHSARELPTCKLLVEAADKFRDL
ncbi:hypothetical protein FRB99_003454 [Tulasnella sp. 403]|nr:hypothetical protein FRB99_003454 [Tulasnella sp. 403]